MSTKSGTMPRTMTVWKRWRDESGRWVEGNVWVDVFQPDMEDLDISDSPPVSRPATPQIDKRKGESLVEGSCHLAINDGLY
jgi:hypothetical protein